MSKTTVGSALNSVERIGTICEKLVTGLDKVSNSGEIEEIDKYLKNKLGFGLDFIQDVWRKMDNYHETIKSVLEKCEIDIDI